MPNMLKVVALMFLLSSNVITNDINQIDCVFFRYFFLLYNMQSSTVYKWSNIGSMSIDIGIITNILFILFLICNVMCTLFTSVLINLCISTMEFPNTFVTCHTHTHIHTLYITLRNVPLTYICKTIYSCNT